LLRPIEWSNKRNTGLGYAATSETHDREKELLLTAYIAKAFKERAFDHETIPVVVPIDEFYRFIPGNSSLVMKTRLFNEFSEKEFPGKNFVIILSGFSDSIIFTKSVLEKIPFQTNAGLGLLFNRDDVHPEVGQNLLKFSDSTFALMMERLNGDLKAVLAEVMTLASTKDEESAKLIIAMCLILHDCQAWQSLWCESGGQGTPLYVVAPASYHHAVNRFNFSCGHGAVDYHYRCMLGVCDEPVFEPEPEGELDIVPYPNQGPSAEDYESRVGTILKALVKQ